MHPILCRSPLSIHNLVYSYNPPRVTTPQVRWSHVHHAGAVFSAAEREKEAIRGFVRPGGAVGAARGRLHRARYHLEGDRPDSQGGRCPQGFLLLGFAACEWQQKGSHLT